MTATHQVTNQPPPLIDYDLAASDVALTDGLRALGTDTACVGEIGELGRLAGSTQATQWGEQANANAPLLRTHDRYGNRIDEVDFHPSWHALLDTAVARGLTGGPWRSPPSCTHLDRAARFYLWSQVESGHLCPVSMTYAAVPVVRLSPELAATYEPGLTSPAYEFGLRPAAAKRGLLAGMGMTEKQGGSDVRTNATQATRSSDGHYVLRGHKWFCSAPMSDLFLVLAQAPAGLSCFLLPRVLPDGERNAFHLIRLKNKLGNRSNASAEVEFDGTLAWLVGDEGDGVKTILRMVDLTRLDCVIGSAALMRRALAEAAHHARHRTAFGRKLTEAPLMSNVLADLALETEAATLLMLRLAAAVDASEGPLRRLSLAVAKYWVCKRAPVVVGEALECLGGNGYVEDSGMPRLYREAPVNSIWEGAGNVNALDVVRVLHRNADALAAFRAELDRAAGVDDRLDRAAGQLGDFVAAAGEATARRVAERLALLLSASLLARYAPSYVAETFCASRLGSDWGYAFGTLPAGSDTARIVARATPLLD